MTRQKQAKTRAKSKKNRASNHVALETERQAQIKTKRSSAGHKSSSAKGREAVKRNSKSNEILLLGLRAASTLKRVTFIVHVTVDEQGQPLSTEVEHVISNGKKNKFPNLDVEKLVAFMRACFGSPIRSEPVNTMLPSSARSVTPIPQLVGGEGSVVILEVMIFRANMPGIMTLTLGPDEDFIVQTRFRLEGPNASSVTARGSMCQIKVFAQELAGGTAKLLTACQALLVKDVLEYAPQAKVPGLSPGLYRLTAWVTLHTPIKTAAHHAKLIVHVSGRQNFVDNSDSV